MKAGELTATVAITHLESGDNYSYESSVICAHA